MQQGTDSRTLNLCALKIVNNTEASFAPKSESSTVSQLCKTYLSLANPPKTTQTADLTDGDDCVTIVTCNERYVIERVIDQTIKVNLLEQVTIYISRNGLQDSSLRPLAEALGISARMLIYHFGSKAFSVFLRTLERGSV
jgi:hypothetical protein